MDRHANCMYNLTMTSSMPEAIRTLAESLIVTSTGHYANAPGRDMARQHPDDALVIWVVAGRGHAETQGVAQEVSAGDLLVFEPGHPHSYVSDRQEPWEIFWFHFIGTRAGDYIEALRDYARPFARIGLDTSLREAFDDLIIEVSEMSGVLSRSYPRLNILCGQMIAAILGRMLHMLQHAQTASVDTNASFDTVKIRRYINRHLTDQLTLDELAGVMDLSVTHFSRLFRQQFDVSPMHYVIQQRMARAATMLSGTRAPVKQIAYLVGYEDPYHFSRLFKKHIGHAPAQWRKRIGLKDPA